MITIGKIVNFVKRDMWTMDQRKLNVYQRGGVWTLQRLYITVECFLRNNLTSYAAALTYNCMLAAVPVLSIIFAIARGFGFGSLIESRLKANLQTNSDLVDTVLDFINHYLEHTHSGVFLGVGLLLLLYTVIMLTSNIETAFNTIWHIRSSRNIYRKSIDYASIFLLVPLLIVVTSGFSVFLLTIVNDLSDYRVISNTMEFVIKYTPVLLSGLAFVALYKYMPNTQVRWRSVLVPGLIAGCLFQILQYVYIHYQLVLSSYNAIYGSFAALPLFMLWMQFSWYICLAGAQLSYACQRSDEYLFSKDCEHLSRLDHDSLCIMVMAHVCRRFLNGEPAFTVHELSKESRLPHSLIQGLVDELVAAHCLSETHNDTGTVVSYLPSMDIHKMTVNHVMHQLDNSGNGQLAKDWTEGNVEWDDIVRMRSSIRTEDGETEVTDIKTN